MPSIHPIAPGICARSEALVETTRDHDRDRTSDQALDQAQRRDTEDLIGVQAAAGFTHVSPGLLTFQDLFRPFAETVDAVEPGPLTRFLDTNTFYRRPQLDGSPRFEPGTVPAFLDRFLPPVGALSGVATLPSPSAFVTADRDEDGDHPEAERADAVGEGLLAPLLEALPDRGYETVVLQDPWLTAHPEPASLLDAIEALATGAPSELTVLVQLPFQDAAPVAGPLGDLAIDGVIVDLVRTDTDALATLSEHPTIGLGIVEARSSVVERPDRALGPVERALETVEPETIWLAPTGDLQHVPETIHRGKLRALGEMAETARAKLGGDA